MVHMRRLSFMLTAMLGLAACHAEPTVAPDSGVPDAGPADAGTHDGGRPDAGPPDSGPSSVDAGPTDAGAPDAGPPTDAGPGCFPAFESEHDGRFGAPTLTFTLPASAIGADHGVYLPDIQAAFPSVDWMNLDRLYIPAGHYAYLFIGNLPTRTAAHPLVMTNIGGQVLVGGLPSGYLVSLGGGANWVLTGRYDPISKTGDAAFPGHKGNCYSATRGTYGIFVDDNFHNDPSGGVAELLSGNGRMGMNVERSATDFEIEYVEIARVTFAGMQIKTHDTPSATMSNVKVHDVYIHDTMSEGFYIGDTGDFSLQHVFLNLQLYNNRVLRTGSEAIQLGHIAEGSRTHHNVSLYGALNWRHNFECSGQDNNVQYGQRYGSADFDHNLIVGGAFSLLIFFPQNVSTDPHQPGDRVNIHDNYFSSSRDVALYAWAQGGLSSYSVPDATYAFQANVLRDLKFTYDQEYPGVVNENAFVWFGADPPGNPWTFSGDTYDGPQRHFTSTNNITASSERDATLAPVELHASGLPAGFDPFRLEVWSPGDNCQGQYASGRPAVPGPPRTYQQGDFVMFDGTLYQLTAATSTNERPDLTPASWRAFPPLNDDVRLAAGSTYRGIGLLDTVE